MSMVTMIFLLNEEVTPELFAQKVALACAKEGTIREGEGLKAGSVHITHGGFEDINVFGKDKPAVTVPKLYFKREDGTNGESESD